MGVIRTCGRVYMMQFCNQNQLLSSDFSTAHLNSIQVMNPHSGVTLIHELELLIVVPGFNKVWQFNEWVTISGFLICYIKFFIHFCYKYFYAFSVELGPTFE